MLSELFCDRVVKEFCRSLKKEPDAWTFDPDTRCMDGPRNMIYLTDLDGDVRSLISPAWLMIEDDFSIILCWNKKAMNRAHKKWFAWKVRNG